MIVKNGYIRFKDKSEAVYNEQKGIYEPQKAEWGEDIPCQWRVTSGTYKGKSNGEACVVAQYEILIEMQEIYGERFQLSDLDYNDMGEYSPISIERLDLVQKIKIIV